MPEVQFEDRNTRVQGVNRVMEGYTTENLSGLTGWFLRSGLVQSRRAAEWVLLIIIATSLLVAGYFYFFYGKRGEAELPAGSRIVYPPNAPPRLEIPQ